MRTVALLLVLALAAVGCGRLAPKSRSWYEAPEQVTDETPVMKGLSLRDLDLAWADATYDKKYAGRWVEVTAYLEAWEQVPVESGYGAANAPWLHTWSPNTRYQMFAVFRTHPDTRFTNNDPVPMAVIRGYCLPHGQGVKSQYGNHMTLVDCELVGTVVPHKK